YPSSRNFSPVGSSKPKILTGSLCFCRTDFSRNHLVIFRQDFLALIPPIFPFLAARGMGHVGWRTIIDQWRDHVRSRALGNQYFCDTHRQYPPSTRSPHALIGYVPLSI